MDSFANIQDSGLLKIAYPNSQDKGKSMAEALKRKREKLAETKLGLEPKEG